MKLYELANEYSHLMDNLYNTETGEINQEAQEKLQALSEPLETKCINVAKIFKNLEAERKAIEEERKNMEIREKSYKRQVEFLKEYLKFNMEKTGIDKISSPYFMITLCNNPPSVDKFNEDEIPTEYKRTKVEIDTQKIREDLMAGVIIPGAKLKVEKSVRIK